MRPDGEFQLDPLGAALEFAPCRSLKVKKHRGYGAQGTLGAAFRAALDPKSGAAVARRLIWQKTKG